MFTGEIEGVGPRYCPSIEDKVVRFAERDQHQIFVEPEGLQTTELYPNGISTSLPFDVQYEAVRTIRGFERAHITRPGYAIEYDFLTHADCCHRLRRRTSKTFFSQVRSTGRPVTKKPLHRPRGGSERCEEGCGSSTLDPSTS